MPKVVATHTPGPWTLGEREGDFVEIDAPDWMALATVCTNNEATNPQGESNARLISAAPELLHACRFVKEFLARLENGTDADDPLTQLWVKFHKPLHDALDAAISKAEGGA